MGSEGPEAWPEDGEGPVREVEVAPFALSATAVTAAEFGAFVAATGHVTDAERYGWSFVFHLFLAAPTAQGALAAPWWRVVQGATWRAPEGPGTQPRSDHPAVHVSYTDAVAYCAWAGVRLPTEAEWEYGARGGLEQRRYPWGDEPPDAGGWRCNIFQGTFPDADSGEDGYRGTAPVTAFAPNGYGLHNMVGNVWEWVDGWFAPGNRVTRGGSYLCHDSYCNRYRTSARQGLTPDSSTGNVGFRVCR